MKLKRYTLIFSSLLLMLSSSIFSQENLENYLKTAAQNNPDLKASFNKYMAAMQKIPQVGTLPDSQAVFGYFIQPVETRVGPQKWKFNLAQSFPWFGLLNAKENLATELANAKFEEFENSKSNLFFEVKTTYYNYYFTEKAIQIIKENINILQVFKRLSLVKIEAGKASIVDELRVELELNNLENKLALFEDSKKTLLIKFNNLLLRERSKSIKIPDTLWQDKLPFDKSAMLTEIYANNHQLKSINHRLNAFINQKTVAKKEGMPKFNIGLNYTVVEKIPSSNTINNGKDAFLFPSVGINIPIFRKKYKALIKETTYLQEVESNKKENKKRMLSTIFSDSYKNYNDGNRRIALNKKQSKIAKKVLDVLITSYSTNATNFEEVLRIESQLLTYELAYQQALIDKNAAIAFMYYLIGK
ncbi:MAG: TolC family protein [Lutibacter sp.]|uniref:TolC family protein n=1 Tax=Lutibacter sp. TaxID=1925666 RepID=UPI00299F0BAA|nr:TolC family protein [Lutibacter sp.]MDX1828689.1 TolC family protein [Lutibacter sp.]